MIPVTVPNLRAGRAEVQLEQLRQRNCTPSHGLIRLLIILFSSTADKENNAMNGSPLHRELPLPDHGAGTRQPSSVPGPPVNPPSQGDPTNPAQPRK